MSRAIDPFENIGCLYRVHWRFVHGNLKIHESYIFASSVIPSYGNSRYFGNLGFVGFGVVFFAIDHNIHKNHDYQTYAAVEILEYEQVILHVPGEAVKARNLSGLAQGWGQATREYFRVWTEGDTGRRDRDRRRRIGGASQPEPSVPTPSVPPPAHWPSIFDRYYQSASEELSVNRE